MLTTASLVGCSSTATKPDLSGDTATSLKSDAVNNAVGNSVHNAKKTSSKLVDKKKSAYTHLDYELYDDPTNLDFLRAAPEEQCNTLFSPPTTVELEREEEMPPQMTVQDRRTTNIARLSTSKQRLFKFNQLNGPHLNAQPPSGKTDLWCRIRDGYKLEVVENSYIQRAIDRYLRSPEFFKEMSAKAKPYLYHIVGKVEQRGMPTEIALLPAIESGFEPFAMSPKSAAGIWQFIPDTGRDYGLIQTQWYDGRRDFIASTDAALDYLEKLHDLFDGDWLTALAAYNYGEGNVRKAIKRNEALGKPTDFWSLDLPNETRWYVPKLLALSKIIANPQEYGIRLPSVPDSPYLKQVAVEGQISLSLAAHLADLSTTDFLRLNAGYNQGVTGPDGPQNITLPIHKAYLFKQRLARTPLHQLAPPPTYYGGITEVSFANQANASSRLMVNNPTLVENENSIFSNLLAYQDPRTQQHLVSKGETLEQIAQQYSTSVANLRQLNHLQTDSVKAGTFLIVPLFPSQGAIVPPNRTNTATRLNNRTSEITSPLPRSFWRNTQSSPVANRK